MTTLETAELLDNAIKDVGDPKSISQACKLANLSIQDIATLLKDECFFPIPGLITEFSIQMFSFAKVMFALGILASSRKKVN